VGCAKYVGRVGALAVALGIGTAVITSPGIAWADETGTTSDDGPSESGSAPAGANAETGSPSASTPGAEENGAITTTTTQQGSTTTTVGGGASGPTVTFGGTTNTGSIGGATTEDSPPPPPPGSSTAAPVTESAAPATADPTTVVATPSPVTPTPTPTPTATAAPAATQDHTSVTATNEPAAAGSSTAAPSTPAGHEAPPTFAARLATTNAPESDALQDNTISALIAPALPVPTVPQPTLADAVLALPGTIISTALNLITAALAPLIGPGAPADNPVLWGVLAFVRRQFNESFANSTPVLAPRQTSQDLDDNQVHGTFGGSDADGDTLAYTVPSTGTGAPAHGTVTVDQATGTYTYTPTAGYVGEDYFFVTATDDTGAPHAHALGQTHTAAARVDVTVAPGTAPVNHAPVAGNDSFTTDEDTAFSGSLLGNDSDVDGNPLHAVAQVKATSAGGSVSIKADGTFTYTPKADFNGTDTFTYTVTDGTGAANASALGAVTMTVNPINDAPTLSVVTEPTGAANGAVKVTLTYAEPEGDLTSGYISTPVHGGLYADAAGLVPIPTGVASPPFPGTSTSVTESVYYIPDPSRAGTETLSFTLTDASGASVTKTAVIEVVGPSEPENHAPTLSVVTEPTGAANGAVKVTLTFAEPDGDVVTSYIAPLAHGGLFVDAAGTVRIPTGTSSPPSPGSSTPTTQSAYYIPDPSRPGTETLSFTLTDASGASVTKTAVIEVEAGPSDPASQPPTVTVERTDNADGTVTLAVTIADPDDGITKFTFSEREHGSLSVGGNTLPDELTGGDTGSDPITGPFTIPFTYTPDPSRPGVETLTFTVTDLSGETASYSTQVVVGTPILLAGSVFTPVPNISYYDLAIIGNRIYVTTYDNTVAVVDRTTGQLTGTPVPFTDAPRSGFAVTPDGKLALITTDYEDEEHPENNGPQGVQIVNLQTGAATFIATDDGPQWVALNETGTKAYVSNSFGDTVTVIDLTGATPTKLFDITGVSGPEAAVVVGNKVYVTSYFDESVLVYDANSAGPPLDAYEVGGPAWAVGATPDGRLVVTTDNNIAVIDPSDDSVKILTLPDGWVGGYGIAVSPNGKRAYATINQTDDDGSFVKSAVLVVDFTTDSFAGGPVFIGTSGTWGVRVSSDGVVYALMGDGSIAPLTEFDPTSV